MIVVLVLLWFFVFFSMLKSGFDYIEYLYEKELKEKEENKEEIKKKAIEKECKRVRKFLNPDGSVNLEAARRYMNRQQTAQRRKIESISFEILE